MKQRDSKKDTKNLRQLMEAILAIDSVDDCRRFFADLCTPAELQSLADRWCVAQLIDKGVPYRQIYDQTGVSTATVTRVARSLTQGQDGYRRALDRMNQTDHNDPIDQRRPRAGDRQRRPGAGKRTRR